MDKLDELLEILKDGKVSYSVVATFLEGSYDELISKYRPVIKALPVLSSKITTDFAPLVVLLMKVMNDIRENPEYKKESDRGDKLGARTRWNEAQAYEKMGFTHEEAVTFVLANIGYRREFFGKIGGLSKTASVQKSRRSESE